MGATLATVDNILKEVYENGGINDQLQSEVTALKRIERSSEGVTHTVGGKYVRFPIRTKRNHGIGARRENTPLPQARSQGYEDAQVKLKYQYGAVELTGQTFELADKDYQAFASALDQEISGVKEALIKNQARQVYGTHLGIIAKANAAGAGTGTGATMVTSDAEAIYLEIGMYVDIHASNSTEVVPVIKGTREITDVSSAGGSTTIVFGDGTAALTSATGAGDFITRQGSYGLENTGLAEMVNDSGTLYDINPANTPVWKSVVKNVGGSISIASMIEVIDTLRKRGGGKPSVGFMSLGVRRAYYALLQQNAQRFVNTTKYAGGFEGLSFTVDGGDIPLVSDVDCQNGTLYFLNEKEIKMYNAGDWSFMDRDGSKWQRKMDANGVYDAYVATLYQYNEIGTHRRNAHAKMTNITEA